MFVQAGITNVSKWSTFALCKSAEPIGAVTLQMTAKILSGRWRVVFIFVAFVCVIGCDRRHSEPTQSVVTSQPSKVAEKDHQSKAEATASQTQTVAKIVTARKRYADSYSILAEQAESGNAAAAYQLYEDLLRCASLDERKEAMEAVAAESADEVLTSDVVRQLAEDRVICVGLSKEQLASREYWTTKAARLGHVEAQLAYFSVATEKFDTPQKLVAGAEELVRIKAEALAHMTSAASRGHPTALFNLANIYYDGSWAKRDPVKAYAYMRVLQRRGGPKVASKYVELWGRELTAQQLKSAETMAAGEIKGEN